MSSQAVAKTWRYPNFVGRSLQNRASARARRAFGRTLPQMEPSPANDDADTTPADAVELAMQPLIAAWAASKQQKVMGKPKPVPDATTWQIYWVKRTNSNTAGDNYFISPRGHKLASLVAARRWLNMFGAAAAGGVKSEAIDSHGRTIKGLPKEKRRDTCRLLAVAELQVGGDGAVRLQLMAATASHRLERLIALRAGAVQEENLPISRRGVTVHAQLVVAGDGLVALQLRCGAVRPCRHNRPPAEWWRGKAQVPVEVGAGGSTSQLGRAGGTRDAPPPKPVPPPRLGARVRLAGGAVGRTVVWWM